MCKSFENVTADNLADFLIGNSPAMRNLRQSIINASRWNFPVLVEGDSGTGKDLVANLLFRLWLTTRQKQGQLVPVDCGTLRGDILTSLLFGHRKGAFTGAMTDARGIFGAASEGGAIFFDELGNLSLSAQALLLRALESKSYLPVGATQEVKFSGRFIAATNKPLSKMVQAATFREDLFFRFNRILIRTPSLREHLEDIPAIINAYLRQLQPEIKEAIGVDSVNLSLDASQALMQYTWPGNVRELHSVIDRALVALPKGVSTIDEEHLHFEGQAGSIIEAEVATFESCVTMDDYERAAILHALNCCGGKISQAATRLGIVRSTLHRRMTKLGIGKLQIV